MQNPSLSSPNNDSSENDESKQSTSYQPMEVGDSASNLLSTHLHNDASPIPATATRSNDALNSDNDMDQN